MEVFAASVISFVMPLSVSFLETEIEVARLGTTACFICRRLYLMSAVTVSRKMRQ